MKKKSFTLLECVIAFGLTALLLSVLFGFYRQNSFSTIQLQNAKQKVLARVHTQERLSCLFRNATLSKGEDGSYFYSRGSALHFTFNNGFDPSAEFCDQLEAVLFLDKQENLSLLLTGKDKTQRQEILLENAKELKLHFFDPLALDWIHKWEENQEGVPPMLKISISQNKIPYEFGFILTASDDEIVYQKKGV
jgi:hypothetical protein